MDIQFYGANCISLNYKTTRIVIDDNLAMLGKKTILKNGDVALFTSANEHELVVNPKILIDCPGEYEIADISIIGIPARAHMDVGKEHNATIYRISMNDISVLVSGHIYPELSEDLLEMIGTNDVLIVPVGGHGYTLDAKGALSIIKELEPKLVIPTHYSDESLAFPVPQADLSEALKDMAMEPKEITAKLKLKSVDLSDLTQLVVLETS